MRERPGFYYDQSAVIPYRLNSGNLQILMITSRKKKRWVIPKGVIEPHLSSRESAANEALEEAGVRGWLSNTAIGTYEYQKWGGTCSVEVYPMRVDEFLDVWLEDYREREWVSLDTAVNRVNETRLKALLQELPAFLED